MNTNKLVAQAVREVFDSGVKKATHKQIAQAFLVLLLGESHAAETALMTPTVSKIVRDGLKGIQANGSVQFPSRRRIAGRESPRMGPKRLDHGRSRQSSAPE